ncbi:MAG: hypothetical protein AAFR20_03115 [Pseudomonadota bacterium]
MMKFQTQSNPQAKRLRWKRTEVTEEKTEGSCDSPTGKTRENVAASKDEGLLSVLHDAVVNLIYQFCDHQAQYRMRDRMWGECCATGAQILKKIAFFPSIKVRDFARVVKITHCFSARNLADERLSPRLKPMSPHRAPKKRHCDTGAGPLPERLIPVNEGP